MKMPDFPELDSFRRSYETFFGHEKHFVDVQSYERARAEAWAARARLAVEALRQIEGLIGQLSPVHFVDREIGELHAAKSHDITWAALKDIGELPPA